MPNHLQTFQSAKVALILGAAATASNLNVFVCPAQHQSPAGGACEGPFAQPFSGAANQLIEVEIGSMLSSRIGINSQV